MKTTAWKFETREQLLDKLYNDVIEAKNELAWAEKFGTETEKIRAADHYEVVRIKFGIEKERR